MSSQDEPPKTPPAGPVDPILAEAPNGAKTTRLDLVESEWTRQLGRKASLEQRGITVITTSGVLVTLVFGFTAAVSKGKHFANFTHAEKLLLGIALILFVLSGFLALVTNIPGRIGRLPLDMLRTKSSAYEPLDSSTLDAMIKAVQSVRVVNGSKANWLVFAFAFQLLAILTVGGTVVAIVL